MTSVAAKEPHAPAETLVGRQPIFDRTMNVVAYELLYRSSAANHANVVNQDQATSQVIINSFLEIGLQSLVGSKLAYINMPEKFLTGQHPIPFSKEQVVLEVLEHVEVHEELLNGLRRLRDAGYTIALDDFELTEKTKPLVRTAQIIKLDVMNIEPALVRKRFEILRRLGVKLLAEKIETQEMFEFCKKLGFDFFQGYFLCRPNIVKGAQMPTNRLALLQLLSDINKPDIEVHQLEKTVSRDVGLSYKLLRVINSAQFGVRNKVESLKQALVMLGMKNIKHWATLIAMASIDNKPYELIVVSLQRARMCQLIAEARRAPNGDAYFTAGLFSTLDAVLDKPFAEVLPQLSLTEELNAALEKHEGPIGAVLKSCMAYEQGDWAATPLDGLSATALQKSYLESIRWASDILTQMLGAPPAASATSPK